MLVPEHIIDMNLSECPYSVTVPVLESSAAADCAEADLTWTLWTCGLEVFLRSATDLICILQKLFKNYPKMTNNGDRREFVESICRQENHRVNLDG